MALIACGQCAAQMSDRAAACPSCGFTPSARSALGQSRKRWTALGAALVFVCLQADANAVYKCGNVFQDKPCAGGTPGEQVKVFEDRQSEQDRWDAELRRSRQSGFPFVAKYPYIYSFINGQWFKDGLVGGKRTVVIVSPSDDPDVAQMNLQLKVRELDRAQAHLQDQLEQNRAAAEKRAQALTQLQQEQERQASELRREQACRGRSPLDPVCSGAK